jgi:hypothetical protein
LIDFPALNLITDPSNPTSGMTKKQATAFLDLKRELFDILDSESNCPGDGNLDGLVNRRDLKTGPCSITVAPVGTTSISDHERL